MFETALTLTSINLKGEGKTEGWLKMPPNPIPPPHNAIKEYFTQILLGLRTGKTIFLHIYFSTGFRVQGKSSSWYLCFRW